MDTLSTDLISRPRRKTTPPRPMSDGVTLRSETGPDGSRYLHASLDADGSIVLEGHDLSRGVEAFWGSGHSEYEWIHTIPASETKMVREALGGMAGCDVLRLIERWCAQHDVGE